MSNPPHTLTVVRDADSGLARVRCADGSVLPIVHIIGIGRNYAAHAGEQGLTPPERPMVFTKNPASVILDGEPIVLPRICADREQVDFEGELAVVIGRRCRDVSPDEALAPGGPVLGCAIANDVSARWWQKEGSGGQFCRGKSFDTFCPLSPVTPLERVPDPRRLTLETRVSDEVMQRGSTADMIFPVATLIAELSRDTTLAPGTVILTGTPEGVGMARTPPRFLRDEDTVEITIEGLGTLTNPVRSAGG